MIDYLEQLFSAKAERQPEKNEPDPSNRAKRMETAREIVMEVPAKSKTTREAEEGVSTRIPERGELFWQQEAIRRVERAIDIPEEERLFPNVSRPEERRTAEDLERRLRRNSRRYDSGFYLY